MGVPFNRTILETVAQAKTALDETAADPASADRLIEGLPGIMGRLDFRYTVKNSHIDAMLTAARAGGAARRHQAVMAILPYPKFWGRLNDDDVRTSAERLVINEDVKALAGIVHDFRGDIHFNRVIAPYVTQMGRCIKKLTDEKKRDAFYEILAGAVRGSSVQEGALAEAGRPPAVYGGSPGGQTRLDLR